VALSTVDNILSITGFNKNDIATAHLVNTDYCVPTLLYGCEVWCLKAADYHKANVKVKLFRAFCLFYAIALWKHLNAAVIQKFHSCYIKCVKLFFIYRKYDSVTGMLLDTSLPSCETVMFNAKYCFQERVRCCQNPVIIKVKYVCMV